ncbi:MAG: acylphosphatase [Rhodoferax sp.]|uniref:acylphosphatase n=1 Tax=Rhodoferax sp. TaxID=50421 RepID=UPI0014011824|nr:acylphosphatase [Rhodoferax sp.]NDP39437.1 acylphosphatase [Rhodoferax sp.]
MADVTYRLVICGLVQGVFYRGSMVSQANALGLRGWVRNRLDGSVEAMVQGEATEVNRMIEWARRGPSNAVVTSVDIFPREGDFVGFQQREST